MFKPRLKVYVYSKLNNNTWSNTPTEFKNFDRVTTRKGIKTTKDYFNIRFQNRKDKTNGEYIYQEGLKQDYNKDIKTGDLVEIYGFNQTTGSVFPLNDDTILFNGIVNEFEYNSGTSGLDYTVKGCNRTEELLNTYIPATYSLTGSINTPPKFVKEITRRVNRYNPSRNIWAYFNDEVNPYTGSYGNVQRLTAGGNEFTEIEYREDWMSAYLMFEKISTQTYTNPGNVEENAGVYVYGIKTVPVLAEYIGANVQNPVGGDSIKLGSYINEVYFRSKPTTSTGIITEGDGVSSVKINKDVNDVKNAYIVNAGKDLYSKGIRTIVINNESFARDGARWDIYNSIKRFDDLKNNEIVIGSNYLGSTFDSYGFPDAIIAGSTWSFDHTNQFNYSIKTYNDSGSFTGYATANSKDTYNRVLKVEAKRIARLEAQQAVDNLGNPKYTATYKSMIGSNDFIEGDLFECRAKTFGWNGDSTNPGYKLRLNTITQNFSNSGWETSYEFAEDEKTISDKVNS